MDFIIVGWHTSVHPPDTLVKFLTFLLEHWYLVLAAITSGLTHWLSGLSGSSVIILGIILVVFLRSKLLRQPPLGDHVAGQPCGRPDVGAGAGGDVVEGRLAGGLAPGAGLVEQGGQEAPIPAGVEDATGQHQEGILSAMGKAEINRQDDREEEKEKLYGSEQQVVYSPFIGASRHIPYQLTRTASVDKGSGLQ